MSVKQAKDRIEQLVRDLDDMKATKAMAELNEMASGMVTQIGGSGDTLNRLEEMVEDAHPCCRKGSRSQGCNRYG